MRTGSVRHEYSITIGAGAKRPLRGYRQIQSADQIRNSTVPTREGRRGLDVGPNPNRSTIGLGALKQSAAEVPTSKSGSLDFS